jgi:hypothetical protein
MLPGLLDQFGRRVGNGLEVDIAAEIFFLAQLADDLHHVRHSGVWRTDDTGGQEQTFDVIAPVEIDGQAYHLVDREPGPRHVR